MQKVLGDGIWSVFTICAALFDAPDNSTVVIDEPELSVHPAIQKRMMELFVEYSRNVQIIISTHSPYFISWQAIVDGAGLLRTAKENNNCKVYCLNDDNKNVIRSLLNDLNNPHTFGIDANEVFFLEDRIILGLPNSSNPVEKDNDLNVAARQKHNGMAWSYEGSGALSKITVAFRNGEIEEWLRNRAIPFSMPACDTNAVMPA